MHAPFLLLELPARPCSQGLHRSCLELRERAAGTSLSFCQQCVPGALPVCTQRSHGVCRLPIGLSFCQSGCLPSLRVTASIFWTCVHRWIHFIDTGCEHPRNAVAWQAFAHPGAPSWPLRIGIAPHACPDRVDLQLPERRAATFVDRRKIGSLAHAARPVKHSKVFAGPAPCKAPGPTGSSRRTGIGRSVLVPVTFLCAFVSLWLTRNPSFFETVRAPFMNY
jgi:hypothetical protein